MEGYVTTAELALRLGVSVRRAQQLAKETEGAEKVGRDWVVPESALEALKARPTPGGARKRSK